MSGYSKNRTTWDVVKDVKINELRKENQKLREDNAKLLAYIQVLQGQKESLKIKRKEKIETNIQTFSQKISSLYQGFIKWLNT